MKVRLIIAIAAGVIATLILVVGLIDPLEGGIALLIATALFVAVRLLSSVPMPKLWWIPTVVAIVVGATALAIVIFAEPQGTVEYAPNPALDFGVIGMLWAYRAAVLAAIAGAVVYVVRLIRALRAPAAVTPARDATTTGGM